MLKRTSLAHASMAAFILSKSTKGRNCIAYQFNGLSVSMSATLLIILVRSSVVSSVTGIRSTSFPSTLFSTDPLTLLSSADPLTLLSTDPLALFSTYLLTLFSADSLALLSAAPLALLSTDPLTLFSADPLALWSADPPALFSANPLALLSAEALSLFSAGWSTGERDWVVCAVGWASPAGWAEGGKWLRRRRRAGLKVGRAPLV